MSSPPAKKRRRVQVEKTRQAAPAIASTSSQPQPDMQAMVNSCVTAAIPAITQTVLDALQRAEVPSAPTPDDQEVESETQTDNLASQATAGSAVAFDTLTAGPSSCEYVEESSSKRNISKPIDLGLDPKIKTKIVSDEFVDMGVLLNPGKDNKERYTTEIKDGSLSLVKLPAAKKVHTLSQWLACFHVFGAIYSKRHQDRGHQLFEYARRIQAIAEESGDHAAMSYDRSFRLWRERDPHDCPWDQLNVALYHEALSEGLVYKLKSKPGQPFQSGVNKKKPFQGTANRKRVYCHSYNNNSGMCKRGPLCTYPHTCQYCGGPHDRTKCTSSQQQPNTNGTTHNDPTKQSFTKSSHNTNKSK
ncbi:uncharacterized protein [Argopecten irradians]|uniref:uncharacterized protein isoform X2 n=1 Tax=Argopecten irradians TaxID=31199 RepID=UPI003721BF22